MKEFVLFQTRYDDRQVSIFEMGVNYHAYKEIPAFYQQSICNGLQSFLAIKCNRCHQASVEIPASLPIATAPTTCINNKSVQMRGKSEIQSKACCPFYLV